MNRKPRGLCEIDRWKATEFRHFALYFGPIVLKDIISEEQYHHFLAFHVAASILTNDKLSKVERHIKYAEELLVWFVHKMKDLYGVETLSYNIHSLTHVADDVRNFNTLDSVSCFPFENFLGYLKSLIRSPNRPLAQIVRRLSEQNTPFKYTTRDLEFKKKHTNGPISNNIKGFQYGSLNK